MARTADNSPNISNDTYADKTTGTSSGMTRIQRERRKELMDATMEVITEHGLTGLTLARVAKRVGLTAAMINFHFDSKETLLMETLREVAKEFAGRVENLVSNTVDDPKAGLRGFLDLHFDPDLTNPNKVGIWFAFMGDATARQTYLGHFENQDRRHHGIVQSFIAGLLNDEKRADDAYAIASGLVGILECQWQDRLMEPDSFDEKKARAVCERYLNNFLPDATI